MTISFKQFSTIIDTAEKTPEQLDEILGKIFGKAVDIEDKKNKVLTAKDLMAKKKKKEEERKKELDRNRDKAFLTAKKSLEGKPARLGKSDRDEYALHRQMKEEKSSFSSDNYQSWKEAALAAGFKVKKIAGNKEDSDQQWYAYDKLDNQVGEFTEGKSGWLKVEE